MSEMDRNEALRSSIRDRVLRRAGTDENFRRLLMENPNSAIAVELGIDVPEGVHVTVLQEGPNEIFVVLPSGPANPQQPKVTGVERLSADAGSFGYAANNVPAQGYSAGSAPAQGYAANNAQGLGYAANNAPAQGVKSERRAGPTRNVERDAVEKFRRSAETGEPCGPVGQSINDQ